MLNTNNNPKTEAARKYGFMLVKNFGARNDASIAWQLAQVHALDIHTALEIIANARNNQTAAANA